MEQISKNVFFERFKDPEIFQSGNWNLLRVIQSALYARLSERNKKKNAKILFLAPVWVQQLYLNLKAFRKYKELPVISSQQKYLLICPIRFIKDPDSGKEKNIYIEKLLSYLGRQYCHIHYRSSLTATTSIEFDSILPDWLSLSIRFSEFDSECVKMLREIYHQIIHAAALQPDDHVEIQLAFENFWREARLYYSVLKNSPVKTAFIYPAYQNEALVYALRKAGIRIIELQHGVISKGANFYVYPAIVNKVKGDKLLPDEIWVWGNYWKNVLLKGAEFKKEQIKVAGDFISRPAYPQESDQKEKILLIALSSNTQAVFIPYIKQLEKQLRLHPDWRIQIKLHPGDPNNQVYLDAFGSLEKIELVGKQINIAECLRKASIQISIYSNTLFEAIGTGTLNFCLDVDAKFKGFVDDVVAAGVAYLLQPAEDPIEKFEALRPTHKELNSDDFFAKFPPGNDMKLI